MSKQRQAHRKDETLAVCPPELAGRSLGLRIFGWLCRIAVVACAAMGLSGFVLSALYPELSLSASHLAALVTVVLVTLGSLHWAAAIVSTLAALGGGLVYLLLQGDLVATLHRIAVTGYNAALDRLYDRGYYSMMLYRLPDAGGDAVRSLTEFSVVVSVMLALVVGLCLVKRARVGVVATLSTVLLVPLFTYNVPPANGAITLAIAGFAAAIVLAVFDRTYDRADDGTHATAASLYRSERPVVPEDVPAEAPTSSERRKARPDIVTVEDELTDYFRPAKKKPAKVSKREPAANDAETARRRAREQLRKYDRETLSSRRALGGMSAAILLAVCLLVMAIPTATVKGAFSPIPSVDRRVEALREYVTARLRGDDPVLDLYAYLESIEDAEPHTTTASTREYEEIKLLHVASQYGANLYLPTFIGVDYEEGAWQYFDDEAYAAWRDRYGVRDTPSEARYIDFLRLMQPSLLRADVDFVESFDADRSYGLVSYQVNFTRMRLLDSLVLMPRVYDASYGIVNYRTAERREDLAFANAFDGIYTGHLFDVSGLQYGALVRAPIQTDPEWIDNVAEMIACYETSRAAIDEYEQMRNKYGYEPDFASTASDTYTDLFRMYMEKTRATDRREMLRYLEQWDTYADFAYETYLDGADGEILSDYIARVVEQSGVDAALAAVRDSTDAETYRARHALTMALIDELALNYTYTRTITAEAEATLDGVENFLTVTREGYCVQFASTVALALRELGIPARYMEGYLASDYTYNMSSTGLNRYTSYVRDSDEHAWVEVWYDGVGWIVYETTPAFYTDMYGNTSQTATQLPEIAPEVDPADPSEPTVEPETPDTEPIEPPTDPAEPQTSLPTGLIVGIAATVLAVVAVTVATVWWLRRVRRAEQERQERALRMLSKDVEYADETDRAAAARAVVRETLTLLDLCGTPPERGELSPDYARRLATTYADLWGDDDRAATESRLARVLTAVQAEEFGYGMTREQMRGLADLYLALRKTADRRIPPIKRAYLRYIKRML